MQTDLAPADKMADDRPVRRPEPPPWGAVAGQAAIWPTPLQTDLLRATLLKDERGLAAWRRIRPRLDVAAMDYGTHALLPQLRSNLIALGVDDDPLLELFKGVQRFAWARTQILLTRVMPIVAALEQRGLPTMLLKGAAMLVDGRRHAGMRHMGDI
ncbi:MAG TPA: nucleotidyltransferase family protein, partial [Vicinamibacterales bacterium]